MQTLDSSGGREVNPHKLYFKILIAGALLSTWAGIAAFDYDISFLAAFFMIFGMWTFAFLILITLIDFLEGEK